MAENKPGWIKLHRSLINWEWWDDHNTTRILIYLLISVNYEQKKWMGQTIEPGQLITSWDKLSENTGMTVRQCRTSIEKLEKSDQITRKSTNKWQAITLLKWDKLQGDDSTNDKPATSQRQTNDKPATTTKECTTSSTKEYKELKEGKELSLSPKGESIDWKILLETYNGIFGKKCTVVSAKVQTAFKARLKEGYMKPQIMRAMENVKQTQFHRNNNYLHATLEFFSRSSTLDKYADIATKNSGLTKEQELEILEQTLRG